MIPLGPPNTALSCGAPQPILPRPSRRQLQRVVTRPRAQGTLLITCVRNTLSCHACLFGSHTTHKKPKYRGGADTNIANRFRKRARQKPMGPPSAFTTLRPATFLPHDCPVFPTRYVRLKRNQDQQTTSEKVIAQAAAGASVRGGPNR